MEATVSNVTTNEEKSPIIELINELKESVQGEEMTPDIQCKCCMMDCIKGGVCYHGPKKNDGTGTGVRCNGDVASRIKSEIVKNTNAKTTERCYYVTPASLACQITEGEIEVMSISKEDLQKIINDEAVLIFDKLVIGVKG